MTICSMYTNNNMYGNGEAWSCPSRLIHDESYCIHMIKIFMTRDQFPRNIFTQRQKQMIRFMLFLYAIYFLQARIPAAASRLDLTFWKECKHLLLINPELVHAVDKSIKNDMWQLSREFTPLSLCDRGLNLQTKEEVAGAIMQVYRNNGHLLQTKVPAYTAQPRTSHGEAV